MKLALNLAYLNPFSWMKNSKSDVFVLYDRTLLWCSFLLLAIGFLSVTSASMPIAQRLTEDPLYFAKRDGAYICVALLVGIFTLKLPTELWHRLSGLFLIVCLFMLGLVLVVGSSVNGASRWLSLGVFNVQPAEFTKLAMFCYIAGYLTRKASEVRSNLWGFAKPLLVMGCLSLLLLLQPDLGTVIVIFATTLVVLFLAGAKLWQFIAIISAGVGSIVMLIIMEPYRMRRILTFLDPWEDPYGSGYQLTMALMAFGRGGLFGQGVGNSVQKLDYLPEAHTDFVMAILAEELGYLGVLGVLAIICVIIYRALMIGKQALLQQQQFNGYLSFAIAVWFGLQTLINVGAASGMLPTKGLTLPLVSYGGSSLLVMTMAVAILVRIDFELRLAKAQAFIKGDRG